MEFNNYFMHSLDMKALRFSEADGNRERAKPDNRQIRLNLFRLISYGITAGL